MSRTKLVVGGLGVLVVGVFVFGLVRMQTGPVADNTAPDDTAPSTDGALSGSVESPALIAPSDGSSDVPTQVPAPGQAPLVAKTEVIFPYAEAARDQTYYIPWTAAKGVRATVSLVQNGVTLSALPLCTDMPVRTGTAYCTWTPGVLAPQQSASGFALMLTTYNTSGTLLQSVRTAPFPSVAQLSAPTTKYENTLYGWSVRYPVGWRTETNDVDRMVFADTTEGLRASEQHHEAFLIESCSLAREACVERRDAFVAAPGTRESALGGKATLSRVVAEGTGYVRYGLFTRGEILFFTTVRAIDTAGTIRSPYVRAALNSFSYEYARRTAASYESDGLISGGRLFVEQTDGVISYVRLFTGAAGCKSEASTASFLDVSGSTFLFTEDSCRIKGRLMNNTFTIEEDDCYTFHTNECEFEGVYTPMK